jgi:hypothetical protein
MTRLSLLLLPLLLAAPLRAGDATTARFNEEVQGVWDRLRPAAETELRRQAGLQVGAIVREPKVEVDLLSIRSIDLDLARAPGLTDFSDAALALRVPSEGTWRVQVEGEVEVRYKLLGRWRKLKLPVRVEVKDIRVSADAAFDWTDPARPRIARIGTPDVFFRVRVRTPGHILTDLLARALSPLGSIFARRAAAKALDALTPQLDALKAAFPGAIPAEGAPLLVDSGSTTPVSAVVAGVDAKIVALHLPHGIIHPMRMDVPATETWLQAYGPNGTGNPGQARPHGDGGDSSAFTAHYIAAQAYRWALTNDPAALANVKKCLVAYGDMLALHGETGLMARVAAPEASAMGQVIVAHNSPASLVRGVRRGEAWVATNGDKGDSRDVYIEIVFGLSVVHDLISDPQVRAETARILTSMIGYLVRERWIIDKDRAPVDFSNPAGSTFPTFWLGVPTQKIALLLTAARLDPARFAAELDRWSPLTRMAWLSQWTGTFSLDDYFGYVLAHVTYHTHLRQETDLRRWTDMSRAYRVMRRYMGHHRNAQLDALHLALDPADVRYRGAIREGLVRFVTRPHRKVAPATFDPSAIAYAPFTFPTGGYGAGASAPLTVLLPTEPLSPELRAPEDDMIWQRSPFKPYTGPGQGDPYIESTGLDLVNPYWIARYAGVAFP